MTEIRCKNCGKLLGKYEGTGEVKCPRTNCGGKNIFDTRTGYRKYIPMTHTAMKNRTTSSGVIFR